MSYSSLKRNKKQNTDNSLQTQEHTTNQRYNKSKTQNKTKHPILIAGEKYLPQSQIQQIHVKRLQLSV